MNITECYDLHSLIRELEAALQIDGVDFEEKDIDVIIKNVRTRISRQYQINLSEYKIDSAEFDLSESRESVILFIENIARIHAKFCGYAQIERYTTNSSISLSSINWLGFTEDTLKVTLKALQRKVLIPKAIDNIQAIKGKLGTINNCWEKRLFVLMVIASDLGFDELMACIAEILFQGTLK